MEGHNDPLNLLIKQFSDDFDYSVKDTAIILAAGHGKRIKSHTSKMLHEIWGKPTSLRVAEACEDGLKNANVILVVGIKAAEVIQKLGKKSKRSYVLQAEQKGTGHAVQEAIKDIDESKYEGTAFVFPGDMGLIDAETVEEFKNEFYNSDADMTVLTGIYEGDPNFNSYGRIIRVKEKDRDGNPSGEDFGKVIEIKEHKDILKLADDEPYVVSFRGKEYEYTKRELIENNEFNSGVFAFKFRLLKKLINEIDADNAQGEIYLTDMISIFNNAGYTVGAVSPKKQYVIMGFNDKTVLKQMNSIARKLVYEKIKNLVEIADPENFFIADEVVEQILQMDEKGILPDIKIGVGVCIGENVKISSDIVFKRDACINGNVKLGEKVTVGEGVQFSTFPNQTISVGNGCVIMKGNIIKGNVEIGENTVLESGVRVTGSDCYLTRIGSEVTVKGISYIFGSILDDGVKVEHSILINKRVEKILDQNGDVIPVRYFIPNPEGTEAIKKIG